MLRCAQSLLRPGYPLIKKEIAIDALLRDIRIVTVDQAPEHNKIWYLQQSELFANATDDVVEGVSGIFRMVTYPRKTRIFDLGDTERTIFVLKRGAIRLARLTPDGKEVSVTVLGAGAVFGEEMLFAATRRTTIAVVIEDALVCCSRAEDLFAKVSEDATLALNVADMLNRSRDEAWQTVEDFAYAKLGDRLMHVFTRLAREHGHPTPTGRSLGLRLTHADIASLVGSTRESVTVEVNALIRSGLIIADGKSIVIPNFSDNET